MFINNTSGNLGGAIASQQEVNLTIDNNAFAFNSAVNGGAINDVSSNTLSITANAFLGNTATNQGNSIWLDGYEGTVNGQTTPTAIINQLVSDNFLLLSNDIAI